MSKSIILFLLKVTCERGKAARYFDLLLLILGSTILEGIETAPVVSEMLITENIDASQGVLEEDEVLLKNPELLLLGTTGDKNLPLPGFSQTFQSPPPPGPPQ